MISQSNLSAAIERTIPALASSLRTPECKRSIYKQVEVLSHHIADTVCSNQILAAKRALRLTERLYAAGDPAIRAAVENVFVFSISGVLARLRHKRGRLLGLLPLPLSTLYINQVLRSSC